MHTGYSLFNIFSIFKPTVYIQISSALVTLKNFKTGEVISEVPEMAVRLPPKAMILAVGPEARQVSVLEQVDIVNPFGHPRSLVSDFNAAQQFLKYQFRRVQSRSMLVLPPKVVLHPMGSPEGGFTQIELRALREIALGAGAAHVTMWTGRPLSDQEVVSRSFLK